MIGEGDILKELLRKHEITQERFAEIIGTSRVTISNLTKKSRLSEDWKLKICTALGVSKDVFTSKEIQETSVNEPEVIPLIKDKVKGKALPETSIPVYNDGGSAGHAELYNDFKERPAAFIRVPGYEDCDFATYAYGHSMYPVIESGCLILCRKTQGKQMIMWGEIYYIITSDYRMIKRLQRGSSKEYVMAVSENDEQRKGGERKFEPIEIAIDEIKEIYLVKGIIKKIQI